jgi:transposase-like protein
MDLKDQIIEEYLLTGCGFRKLAAKYGVSRTTICKWVLIHQGIHNLPATEKQQTYSTSSMNSSPKKTTAANQQTEEALLQKIAMLEKQLAHQELKVVVLDTLINVAEKQLNISIRKKPGTQQSKK